jgi:hypothetical protein
MTVKQLAEHLASLAKNNPHAMVYFGCYPDPKLTRICTVQLRDCDATRPAVAYEKKYVFIGQ